MARLKHVEWLQLQCGACLTSAMTWLECSVVVSSAVCICIFSVLGTLRIAGSYYIFLSGLRTAEDSPADHWCTLPECGSGGGRVFVTLMDGWQQADGLHDNCQQHTVRTRGPASTHHQINKDNDIVKTGDESAAAAGSSQLIWSSRPF